MSEDTKYNTAGALTVKPISDDRKLSQSPAPAVAPPTKKVIIKSADMLLDIQKEAVDIAVAAFEKYNVEKDVAEQIKKEFDKMHGPTWHCIVGRNFASCCSMTSFNGRMKQKKKNQRIEKEERKKLYWKKR
ncbi:unnamed protein product [Lupinus luteus]|uniref:Dynein light chain n=1 Tax=Lupinus luteus TaxID=3873 RepID=A0AAV1VWU6_LUPLU